MSTLFLALAAVVVVVLAVVAASRALPLLKSEDDLPATRIQRQARLGTVILGTALVAVVGVLAWAGPEQWDETTSIRIAVYAAIFGSILAYVLAARATVEPGEAIDERDQAVLARAGGFQGGAVLTALALQTIVVTELYSDAGAIPVPVPYLVFLVSFLVFMAARPLGILIGYRVLLHAEG